MIEPAVPTRREPVSAPPVPTRREPERILCAAALRLGRLVLVGLLGAALVLRPRSARAQAAPPAPHEDIAFDFMNLLSRDGLHDLDRELWNAYGQCTYISSWKLPFQAPYTNADGSIKSLAPDAERSFTASFTLFFGVRLWPGAEAYLVPEVISERALSGLNGIGGSIQNFELQKSGGETPQLYRARTFLHQTIGLGGKPVVKTSDPMQLGATVGSRRLVLTAGTFTILDVFDRNGVTGDPRQTFLNMAFMTHASWDFAADARGYSLGATAELYWDDWAARIGRMAPPLHPNVLPITLDLANRYADAIELEHDHVVLDRPGAVRVLAYRNQEVTGRFDDAIAALEMDPTKNAAACPQTPPQTSGNSGNFRAPDVCWVRKLNTKVGVGVNVEQYLTRDVGVFFRGMYSDGQTEVDAFNSADRSLSFGAVGKGGAWGRPFDVAGLGFGASFISDLHARYLAMGGIDGFVGDGHLRQAPEMVADAFYSFNLLKAIWLTADYQRLWNPGFNADRGPVDILAGRAHLEF
ncbi:MAG: carbohydrate porin [Myxococcales bacterium]|nr:carbohydrate porin [Myxococcales bacterium]